MVYPNEVSRSTKSTAGGTSYIEVVLSLDADACLVLIPDLAATNLLLVAHGHSGDEQTVNGVRMIETRDRMLDNGWVVASSNAKGNGWGNNASQAAYVLLNGWVHTNIPTIANTVLYGQSMGALIMALIYANGTVADARGLVTIDGAVNLAVAHANASYRGAIRTAYGIASDGSDYATLTVGHDPCVIAASLYDDKRLLVEASTGDSAIPKATHSDVFAANITGHPDQLLRLTGTGAHVAVENYFPANVEAFLLSTLQPLPPGDVVWVRKSSELDGEPLIALHKVGVCWQPLGIFVTA